LYPRRNFHSRLLETIALGHPLLPGSNANAEAEAEDGAPMKRHKTITIKGSSSQLQVDIRLNTTSDCGRDWTDTRIADVTDKIMEALAKALDEASEAFADRVPWEDDPTNETDNAYGASPMNEPMKHDWSALIVAFLLVQAFAVALVYLLARATPLFNAIWGWL
jgi:hypothetical protein